MDEEEVKTTYYDNGNTHLSVSYIAHGPFTEFWENGTVKRQGNHKYGRLDGAYTKYHDNGNKKLFAVFVDGSIRNGVLMEWYKNKNRLQSTPYNADGHIHGKLKRWYESGEQSSESNYVNGLMHGEAAIWYENGDDKCVVMYENGEKHGECYEYSETTVETSMYEHGKLVSKMSTVFDDDLYDKWDDIIDYDPKTNKFYT